MQHQRRSIVVIGSSNTDMVVKTRRLPLAGETILGGDFFMNPGGKGANQAVAAARLGGSVSLVASLGNDIFGREAMAQFNREGIETGHVYFHEGKPSGVALIVVDEKGENQIVVAGGANSAMGLEMIDRAKSHVQQAGVLLMQLEVPLEVVQYAATIGGAHGVCVILNPAPACDLPRTLLEQVRIITPNETEASLLSGIEVSGTASAHKAAAIIRAKGVDTVIVTMGEKGAYVLNDQIQRLVPAPKVRAIDSTAAGDVFNGALAVAIAEGRDIVTAVEAACEAAAISVTRLGAQASAPYLAEMMQH